MSRHGLAARKGLGQHFLVDPNTVRKIVRLSGITRDDTVLEVGPGLGSLTTALADACRKVVAIEIDPRVAEALREVVGGHDNVDVLVADALRAPLHELCPPQTRFVANLPYNVATPMFARVLDDVPTVTGGLLMVQQELGERWCTGPGTKAYGAISVKVAFHAEARIAARVPRTVFLPPPKVSSVLVEFRRQDEPPVAVPDPEAFLSFVARVFGHRRKTLRNVLAGMGVDSPEDVCRTASLDPSVRAEQLGLAELARLWHAAER